VRVAAVSHRIKREAPHFLCKGRVARQRATEMRSASVRLRTPLAPEVWPRRLAKSEGKMLRGAFRHCGVITAIAFSAVMFISDARFNVAEAQKARAEDLACGQELQKRCSGKAVPVPTDPWYKTDILSCLAQEKDKLSKKCVARAANVLKSCGADANRLCKGNVAGQGNLLACLTTARGVVSARCNAALDAAYLRQ
jgi:hypothetical protein